MGAAGRNLLAVETQADLYYKLSRYRPLDEPSGEPQSWSLLHFALQTSTPRRGYRRRSSH